MLVPDGKFPLMVDQKLFHLEIVGFSRKPFLRSVWSFLDLFGAFTCNSTAKLIAPTFFKRANEAYLPKEHAKMKSFVSGAWPSSAFHLFASKFIARLWIHELFHARPPASGIFSRRNVSEKRFNFSFSWFKTFFMSPVMKVT